MRQNILIIGFDWNGLARRNPSVLIRKLARDHIDPEQADILLWSFAPTAGEFSLSEHIRVINRRGQFRYMRPFYDFFAPWLLMRDLKRTGIVPDAVVLYDFPFLGAARAVKRAFGSKTVLYLTNLPTNLATTRRAPHLKSAYHHFFELRASRGVDVVIAINETTRAYAVALGVPTTRIFTLPPDTIRQDESFIKMAKKGVARNRFAISDHDRILFSVGRLEPEKGFDQLIRALARLKRDDIALVIAGEGRLQGELEALAREEGVSDRVYFAGNLAREEIWNYYADADTFILLSRSEALGLVVWEAMYAGVPVIVSGAGGLRESVGEDGERGFLWVEENGTEDLSLKLDQCFNRATAEPMLERAKAYVLSQQKNVDLLSVLSLLSS